MLSDEEINILLFEIYSGKISIYNLPENLYNQIAEYLNKGWNTGLGEYVITSTMEQELALNVYLFSAAKTFNYVLSTQGLIVENGSIVPFKQFKEAAMEVYGIYNKTWLETEYITALGQGESIALWNTVTAHPEAGEYLEYDAVIDSHTSEICRPLEGVIRHKNDPFWRSYSPLNHYRCRCTIRQVMGGETSEKLLLEKTQEADKKIQPAFKGNAALDKKIFSDNSPYFDIPAKYQGLARKNFNLPIPKWQTGE